MIAVFHLPPDNEIRRESYPDETPHRTLEYRAWMVDALHWEMEDDHVDAPAHPADVERGLRGGGVVGES
jgi:hypothetical protein